MSRIQIPTVMFSARIRKDKIRAIKIIAAEKETTLTQLLNDAMDYVITKRGEEKSEAA